jgi:hypothetical protein
MSGCDACGANEPASTPLIQVLPKPILPTIGAGTRDGLPVLHSSAPRAITRVYGSAADLPECPISPSGLQFETAVELLDLGGDAYCLNHALRQEQVFGGHVVRDTFQSLRSGAAPPDPALVDALLRFALPDGA